VRLVQLARNCTLSVLEKWEIQNPLFPDSNYYSWVKIWLTTPAYTKFLCLDDKDEDTFIQEHFLQKNFPADYIFDIITRENSQQMQYGWKFNHISCMDT
jgi:hypothetical protein